MLDEHQVSAAARTLHEHWQAGTKTGDLDPSQRPRDRAEGYAIQAAMQRYGTPFGWKIAATSEAGQKHINVSGPLAGRIFAERVIPDGGAVPPSGITCSAKMRPASGPVTLMCFCPASLVAAIFQPIGVPAKCLLIAA